jgi:hypothetical protein
MLSTLLTFLKYEEQLMGEMLNLASKQQDALIKFNTSQLEQVTQYQIEIAKNLRNAEEKRINLLMNNFGLSRKEAVNLKLSAIAEKFDTDEAAELIRMRNSLREQIDNLQSINLVNRVLANRAKNSVREILGFFTNGSNRVCNVRV